MSRSLEMLIRFRDMTAREVMFMESELETKRCALKDVTALIDELCTHNWVSDHVDQLAGYKQAQPIVYCSECDATRATGTS